MAKKGNPNAAEDGKKGGRPKGSKNKLPRDVRERIIEVWDRLEADGQSLHLCATQDPPWFYVNFVKPLLPKDVKQEVDATNTIRVEDIGRAFDEAWSDIEKSDNTSN